MRHRAGNTIIVQSCSEKTVTFFVTPPRRDEAQSWRGGELECELSIVSLLYFATKKVKIKHYCICNDILQYRGGTTEPCLHWGGDVREAPSCTQQNTVAHHVDTFCHALRYLTTRGLISLKLPYCKPFIINTYICVIVLQ